MNRRSGRTTAPTTNGNNAVWTLQGTAGVSGTLIPLYSSYAGSGGSFVSGGSYYISNANAEHALIGCYHESGQADPWIDAPAVSIGGSLATSRNRGTGTIAGGTGGGLTTQSLIGVNAKDAANVNRTYQFGETNAPLTAVYLAHATYAPNKWRTAFGVNGGANYPEDLWTHYNNVPVEKLSGPSTNEQYGRGATQPYYRHAVNFALGPYNNTGARILTYGSAAPASGAHAAGEIVFNNGATGTTAIAWQCIITGTPGTWRAITSGCGIAPVGYSAGAGGAAVQATSKSTAVTLNKLSGQITLNASSLSAGSATGFTLTNSQVAATDTVIVSIASGAASDSYSAQIDAVGAGSCRISVRNVSAGALAEPVVLNYAVIKAVAA